MNTKDAVKRIWKECFDNSESFVNMFFSEVYDPDHLMLSEHDGKPVSSLLLQPFAINFHGVELPANYICGIATLPKFRMHGMMSALIRQALEKSYAQGAMLCCLNPTADYLYTYYRNFGFCPAFYTQMNCYTDAHPFRHQGNYIRVDNPDTDRAYEFFNRIMHSRPCTIQHSRLQYRQSLMENAVNGGSVIVLEGNDGEIHAMAFAVPDFGRVVVTDVLSDSADAENAVLNNVMQQFAGMPLRIMAYYGNRPLELKPRGMARIVNAMLCLSAIAVHHPKLHLIIRLNDPIIEQNNRVFRISNGKVTEYPHLGFIGKTDFDINPEVFAAIVFGNHVTANILDFPSVRPFMSLMVD
ncbi:MAG: GNAT family N-acetyltransferase [Muribaculum sp.]|nr:GNAT family N-acetyltransferase [Muribaculaceae bacterium]MCM1080893.1 GNAT family N-acetyltransferase [Muribaculum sp.]